MALFSSGEKRRSSCRDPFASPTRGAQKKGSRKSPSLILTKDPHEREREREREKERERLPHTPKNDVPSNICTAEVEFMARQ